MSELKVDAIDAEESLAFVKAIAERLPRPTGARILVIMPTIEEKTEGGIIKHSSTLRTEEVASVVGVVVSIGPDAYREKDKFPNGPYCKEGDFVLLRSYSGTRFKVAGKECRITYDDQVEAVVDDPRSVSRSW